jgi:DNA mismatch repair protein MutL
MARIERLDPATVNRIAAGEVIRRPADAVVELLENALDAGAETIDVTVEGGGFERISVADDGHGMAPDDAERAVQRHTTSKIHDATDVDRVRTLGFRGEALPSIARAGRLELTTRADDVAATRVVLDEGEPSVESAGRAVGTTVTVTDLFAALPARKESLGTPRREFAAISRAVADYALVHPDRRFTLTHDGRDVLTTPGSGAFVDALLAVYNRDVASAGEAVESDVGGESSVRGVVVHPSQTRSKPRHTRVAVNGRPLADGALRRAVVAGYDRLLPEDRSPIAALTVDVPPGDVDVNVHPAKEEVTFTDRAAVTDAITAAVRGALAGADLRRRAALEELAALESDPTTESAFEDVDVIGGFRDLYLLCAADDDLLVVDQHAAHERITFERLQAAIDDDPETANIDPPATLDLDPTAAAALEAHHEAIAALGFDVAVQGTTATVSAVPAPLGETLAVEDLRDALDAVFADGDLTDPRDALLADLACRPSVRAGTALDTDEAERLVRTLGACEQPYACPHGRPTVLSIDERDLAKGFERDGVRFA